MRCFKTLIIVFFFSVAQIFAASSQEHNVELELNNVREFFQSASPVDLAKAQAVLSLSGHYVHPSDGLWGPITEDAFRRMLVTYLAIGGNGPNWGVNAPSDTDRFLSWMDTAANAYLTGGEFPD